MIISHLPREILLMIAREVFRDVEIKAPSSLRGKPPLWFNEFNPKAGISLMSRLFGNLCVNIILQEARIRISRSTVLFYGYDGPIDRLSLLRKVSIGAPALIILGGLPGLARLRNSENLNITATITTTLRNHVEVWKKVLFQIKGLIYEEENATEESPEEPSTIAFENNAYQIELDATFLETNERQLCGVTVCEADYNHGEIQTLTAPDDGGLRYWDAALRDVLCFVFSYGGLYVPGLERSLLLLNKWGQSMIEKLIIDEERVTSGDV